MLWTKTKSRVHVCYLDKVKDDDGGAEALQHLVKMEASDMCVWVSLIHWKKITFVKYL